jgi:hypothetical protein
VAHTLQWGEKPLPLLPAGLRAVWSREALPGWVTQELGLPAGATFSSLDANLWERSRTSKISLRLRNFFRTRVTRHQRDIRDVRLLAGDWPAHLDPRRFPFTPRLRAVLANAPIFKEPVAFGRATFADLLNVRSMGEVSVLEVAGIAEFMLAQSAAQPAPHGGATESRNDWTREIHALDPRFRDLLRLASGTLADHLTQLRLQRLQVLSSLQEFRVVRRQLRDRVQAIRAQSLDFALRHLVETTSGFPPEHIALVMARLGLDGHEPDRFHASRLESGPAFDRVQKLEQRFHRLLPKVPMFLPQLDEALRVLDDVAPCLLTDAATELRGRALGAGPRNVEMVLNAARVFLRRPAVAIVGHRLVRVD